jgi:regulator of cell morphogenesis and NO signaling
MLQEKEIEMNPSTQTVREIALEQPSSMRVFEQYGIDYCCGGRKPLAEACAAGKVEVDAVIAALESAAGTPAPAAEDWQLRSMEELAAHIVAAHHAYVKRELPRLAVLAQKVVNRHGAKRAELPAIQAALATLDEELTLHLTKEETILFPYIVKLERARTSGAAMPSSCFGTVAHPIQMMIQEHDAAGALLAEMRRLSQNFTTPEDACPTYHAFYDGLKEFEQDLHQHIHLENNILFPRAIEAEAQAGESR